MQTKTFAAFGGIRNTLPSERVDRAVGQSGTRDPRTDLIEADNVDIDDSGRASRRSGQAVVTSIAAHSIWSDEGDCFFVQAGTLMRLNADYSASAIAQNVGDSPMSFVNVNGIVYWANSLKTGTIVAGVAQSWGMAVPNAQPAPSIIAGNLLAGTYLYAMTYVRSDGQESGTALSGRIDLSAGAGVRFAWPAPADTSVVQVNIYITEQNGETMFLAASAPAGAGSTTFTGGPLATPLNTQWLDAPPPGQCLAYHRGRIVIAQGAFLFGTSTLGYSYVDMRDYLAVDNTLIRFVIGVDYGLFVGTELGIYFLKGDRFDDMTVDSLMDTFGVAGSATPVDGFVATGDEAKSGDTCVMFATGEGVCFGTPDGQVANLTYDRFQTTMPRSGAAVLRTSQTLTQYLLTLHD